MKIVSLIDNEKYDNSLLSEHGLSLFIEFENKKFILDTGASGNFIYNAKKLGINLEDIDFIVISHGHYDHIGGLQYLLEINSKAKVYIKPSCNNSFYSMKYNILKPIGFNKSLFNYFGNRFVMVNSFNEICNNVFLIPEIQKPFDNSPITKNLYVSEDNTICNDTFTHELLLVFKENNKLNVFTGCSHNGIDNMLYTTKTFFKDLDLNLIIGGFHLKSINSNSLYIAQLISNVEKFNPKKIYTCHCTGLNAYNVLKDSLKEKIDYLGAGKTIIS